MKLVLQGTQGTFVLSADVLPRPCSSIRGLASSETQPHPSRRSTTSTRLTRLTSPPISIIGESRNREQSRTSVAASDLNHPRRRSAPPSKNHPQAALREPKGRAGDLLIRATVQATEQRRDGGSHRAELHRQPSARGCHEHLSRL